MGSYEMNKKVSWNFRPDVNLINQNGVGENDGANENREGKAGD